MNFLVHAWLSYPNEMKTWGNLYADSYKGSRYLILEKEQQEGVVLHRNIDVFTDTHPKVLEIVRAVKPLAGRMAAVFVDVAFDYWLQQYLSDKAVNNLIDFIHKVLQQNIPESGKMVNMLPYLIQGQWLKNYGSNRGVLSAFEGLNSRMNLNNEAKRCCDFLLDDKGIMAFHHQSIFEEIKTVFA